MDVEQILDALPAAAGIISGGRWTYANAALRALAGSELVGTCAFDREGVHAACWARPDGTTVTVEVSIRALPGVLPEAYIVTVADRSALARSEATFRALVESSPDPMFVRRQSDDQNEILWANPAMIALLGYVDAADIVGHSAFDTFVHPGDHEQLEAYRSVAPETTRAPCDLRWVRRDGTLLDIQATATPVIFADTPAVLVTGRDISAQRARAREQAAAEAAMRESEARYRMLFEGSPLPISMFDAETFRFLAVNQKMVDVYGYSREEFFTMTVKDLKRPQDIERMERQVGAAAVGLQGRVGVVHHVRKDGTEIEIDITGHQILFGGRRCALAIGVDVTETRKLDAHVRHSQKMDAIGQLATGIAHDFNNMLTVILSTACSLREDLGPAHPNASDVVEVEAAAERAASLTRRLLAFGRTQPTSQQLMSTRSVVIGIEPMLRRIVSEQVTLTTSLSSAGMTHADPGQLEQAIMNLVVNARDAMSSGGLLSIHTADVDLPRSEAASAGVPAGSYTLLAIRDTGSGMAPSTLQRIFEPFFTTKDVGRGTGMGLATVFAFARQMGGGIAVTSELGSGSTFTIYLPRAEAEPCSAPRPRRTLDPARSTEERAS
jgi:PAS domain S-box-containing protein